MDIPRPALWVGAAGLVALAAAGLLFLLGAASWCAAAPLLAGGAALAAALPWSTRRIEPLRGASAAAFVALVAAAAVLASSVLRCWLARAG